MTEIDKLYDEENNDLIYLYNQKGEEIAFEQVAIIPIRENTYVILKPVIPMEGLGEDEGLVFEIRTNEEQEYLALVIDEKIIDDVFEIYFRLLENEEE
jgi:uncharacterized protein YrzB (UPF0473 family)